MAVDCDVRADVRTVMTGRVTGGRHERPRGIVNDDDIRALGDKLERGGHRILAACASGHYAKPL